VIAASRLPVPRLTAIDPPAPNLNRRDFFADLVDQLRPLLPAEFAAFRHRATMNLLKVYFANERIHYEVWTNSQLGTIEIGLHFEDGPISTGAYLAFFDAHILEIKHELGPAVEMERWTPSWGHLYELAPLTRLDERLVAQIAKRLAALITTLQPLVETAAIPPERSASPSDPNGARRNWRRGRR
jgi:hypothetical protein